MSYDALCFLQVGDGTSGTNRLAPVAVSGLSSGVVMVTAGYVRTLVVCLCLCGFRVIFGACVCVALFSDYAFSWGSWMGFDVWECAGCASGV